MTKSTIFSTRSGYFYQDKVAIYLFLRHLQQRDLKEIFLDYPLSYNQKSLDVRLVTKKDQEKIYEIKSGTVFKNSEEEILSSILDLYEYCTNNKEARAYIIVSHGLKPRISELWNTLVTLQSYKILNSDNAKKLAKDLYDKLTKIKTIFKSPKEVHSFLHELNLDDPFSDKYIGDTEYKPNIEDIVIGELDKVFKIFNSDACKAEYPTNIIFHDCIYKCCSNSGSNKNVFSIFLDVLFEHMTVRRLLSKHYQRPFDLESKRSAIGTEVENDFRKWWSPEILIKAEQSVSKSI